MGKDCLNLERALDQKDFKTIENTVKIMDREIIELFMDKLIEKFHSSSIMKRNFIIWIDCLLKVHFFMILSLPKTTLEKLNSMQVLVCSRTNNIVKLIEVKSKLDSFVTLFSDKIEEKIINGNGDNVKDTPMLLNNESDSDEDKNKKFNVKLKKNKIKVSAVENASQSKKSQKLTKINDKFEKEIEDEIQNIEQEDIEMGEENEEIDDENEELEEFDDLNEDEDELEENDLNE